MHLYTPADLDQLHRDLPHFRKTTEWLRSFLAQPHPDLGRSGSICPFLPDALQLNTIQLSTIRTQGVDQQIVEDTVRQYRDVFLELEPQNGEHALYKALLLLFPDVSEPEAPTLIDGIQQKLKPFFVEAGLMIGEFHPWSNSSGLHNPNFYPLRSPVPMLAIRFMTESDLPFMHRATDQPHLRVRYLEAYLQHLNPVIVNTTKLVKAQEALAQAQLEQANMQSGEQSNPSQSIRKCPFAHLAKVFGEGFATITSRHP
jgi:hypothetical protein